MGREKEKENWAGIKRKERMGPKKTRNEAWAGSRKRKKRVGPENKKKGWAGLKERGEDGPGKK